MIKINKLLGMMVAGGIALTAPEVSALPSKPVVTASLEDKVQSLRTAVREHPKAEKGKYVAEKQENYSSQQTEENLITLNIDGATFYVGETFTAYKFAPYDGDTTFFCDRGSDGKMETVVLAREENKNQSMVMMIGMAKPDEMDDLMDVIDMYQKVRHEKVPIRAYTVDYKSKETRLFDFEKGMKKTLSSFLPQNLIKYDEWTKIITETKK